MEPIEPLVALALPPAPAEPQRPAFPWLASLAPMLGALVLWTMTGSPLSLAFAALGPVVAVASLVDGRRHAASARRRAMAARGAALAELRDEVSRRHAIEHRLAWRQTPSAGELAAGQPGAGWCRDDEAPVVVGRAEAPSALRVSGSPVDEHDLDLLRAAARAADLPVTVPPGGGIGFAGPVPLARAAARAALLQIAEHTAPGAAEIQVPAHGEWSWASALPHGGGERRVVVTEAALRGPSVSTFAAEHRGEPWRIAIAASTDALPPGLTTVVRVEQVGRAVLVREAGLPQHRALVPELVSVAAARAWAEAARAVASREGLRSGDAVPRRVELADLSQCPPPAGGRASLAVLLGVHEGGPLEVDLVREGPHALVAGTSGSGKSEFLLAWLTALAGAYPPELVAFLLVDFKGGAAFEPLRGLPHVAGIVTDLDEAEAVRAVESLRAELRLREEILRDAGVREIAELGPTITLPRLIIVVDEFQAMAERFPDLAPLIADIAARGRSLGVHLVLAAQRPNGVVRENVTANCGLRVSLRVLHRADSLAVLGSERAAGLDPAIPGRAVLGRDGVPVEFQSALVTSALLDRLRLASRGRQPARRPWLDPLPDRLSLDDLAAHVADGPPRFDDAARSGAAARPDEVGSGLAFGLVDEPDRQRRSLAMWLPGSEGPVFVAGAPGSGRSSALGALARAFAERHGESAVAVAGGAASTEWDLLHETLERVRSGGDGPRLLVIDDLDRRHRAWPEEHRAEIAETIEAIVHEGRATGVFVAASGASTRSLPASLREAFAMVLLLRHPARADFVHAGGAGELWRADDPPGAGQWRGRRVQVASAPPPPPPAPSEVPRLQLGDAPVAVVSRAPALDGNALSAACGRSLVLLRPGAPTGAAALAELAAGSGCPIVAGDADAWAANWALLGAIRERGQLVIRAGAQEFRSVVRDRRPPPLLDPALAQCWVLEPGAEPSRRAWPAPTSAGPGVASDARNPRYRLASTAESARDVPRN